MTTRRILSAEEKSTFNDMGFLTLHAFANADELAELRRIFDHLFATRAGWDAGKQFDLAGTDSGEKPKLPQILEPYRFAPELLELGTTARAREMSREYFGCKEEELTMGEHMIFKPPHVGSVTPWHQDQAYHNPEMDERSINFWIPLDDADEENGCMHYVPGSHKKDVLPHHSIDYNPKVHGLEVDEPEKYASQAVSCPLTAGDAVLHLPTTLHYAGPNHSPRQRRAYIISFVAPSRKRSVPVDNYWMREKQTARLEREAASKT